ncbi:MAG: hypothetical protein CMP20_01595 [Rickettsiales bacterium]|nr:hypothetical protein [Rickettsiales bacterium]
MGCGASLPTDPDEKPRFEVDDSGRDDCEIEFMELAKDQDANLSVHGGARSTEEESHALLNTKYGGSASLKLTSIMTADQIIYWIDNAKRDNLSPGKVFALCRRLAGFRDTSIYEKVAEKIDVIWDRNNLQFWKDFAEQQEDSPNRTRILQRCNRVFHGCETVAQAHSLTNLEHLQWWHSQYPKEGIDRQISLVKYGAKDENDAFEKRWEMTIKQLKHWCRVCKNPEFSDALMTRQHGAATEEQALGTSNMSEEHLEYWLEETGNPLFADKLLLERVQFGDLSSLNQNELFELFYIAQELGHPPGKEPINFLDALCRKRTDANRQELKEMMTCFDTEELWKAALEIRRVYGQLKDVVSDTWNFELIKCLAQIYPVEQNDFWVIRYMLTKFSWNYASKSRERLFDLVVELCNQNPRTAFNTQMAINKGDFLVKTLNRWSEPPAYPSKVAPTKA